jgi:hypothetical protein
MKNLFALMMALLTVSLVSGQGQIDLPITWDDTANVNYGVTDFGGNSSAPGVDPTNSSNLVLAVTKTNTAATWAGTTLGVGSLATAIPFATGTKIRALVYSPDSGITVRLKAEEDTNAAHYVEQDAMTTLANGWDTLEWDFASAIGPQINLANAYDKLSIFFNFGVDGATAGTKLYYLDDVFFVAGSTSGPSKAQISLPITWDDTANVDYSVIPFGSMTAMSVVDPTNSANMVLQIDKGTSSPTWAGTTLGNNNLDTAIPFAANANTMKVRFWTPDSGITVRLKAEDSASASIFVEVDAMTTVANDWDTLTFDFSNSAVPINYSNTYDVVSIFPNFGVDGATAGAKTYYIDDVWHTGPAAPATKDITFKVDMQDYTGTYTTVHLNGDFNGWCGGCNPMTDANGDDVWEVTLPLTQDSIEYKFTVDGWTDEETFSGGEPCTKTASGFTNRFAVIPATTTLPEVCWESCSDCVAAPAGNDVTFMVDMADYTGTYDTVYLNGTFNGWCGACNPMTDADGDDVWEVTLNLTDDSIEYKFTVDGWTDDETFSGGEPCTKTASGLTNRFLVISGDTTLSTVCWASCSACAGTPTNVNVTFSVNMATYRDSNTFTGAYINGAFNGWCGTCNPMDDADSNDVWEVTINLPIGDSAAYKFTVDGWTDQESFAGGEPCTKTASGFTNRLVVVPAADTTLATVCWESCSACPTGIEDVLANSFALTPNPSSGMVQLALEAEFAGEVNVYNVAGQVVYTNVIESANHSIDLSQQENGLYLVEVKNAETSVIKKLVLSR